jgi:hypothetical protein
MGADGSFEKQTGRSNNALKLTSGAALEWTPLAA